jgi:hypothetical protein
MALKQKRVRPAIEDASTEGHAVKVKGPKTRGAKAKLDDASTEGHAVRVKGPKARGAKARGAKKS